MGKRRVGPPGDHAGTMDAEGLHSRAAQHQVVEPCFRVGLRYAEAPTGIQQQVDREGTGEFPRELPVFLERRDGDRLLSLVEQRIDEERNERG